MVKNELSIRASQISRIALKVADNEKAKIKKKTNKEVLSVTSKITFKTIKQENTLFETRKNCLFDNINSLLQLKYEQVTHENVLKNNIVVQKLNWSFVKIDKNILSKEAIRQKIATNRHKTVIFENKYERAKLEATLVSKHFENHIEFCQKYDELANKLYNENYPKYERQSYADFYDSLSKEYLENKKIALAKIEKIKPAILQTIQESYEFYFIKETKQKILSLTDEIVDSCHLIENLCIENIDLDVDLQILRQQNKEKLDVSEERKEKEEKIKTNKETIEQESKKINQYKELLADNYKIINAQCNKDFDLSVNLEDEKQNKLLQDVKHAFKLPNNQTFNHIYHLIEKYVLDLCPYFKDYYDNKEKEYLENNKKYRQEIINNLDESIKKDFSKSKEDYLKAIYLKENSSVSLDDLKKQHEENLNKINEDYIASIDKVRRDRKERKQEYLNRKASAKVNLKLADGNKATEIKEVLKLYKKEINAGMAHYYSEASKTKKKAITKEAKEYERKVIEATCPECISYKYSYDNQKVVEVKEESRQKKDLNKQLFKDYSTSKYRRNLNNTTRENALGYLFLSVWAIGFLIFTLFPIIYTVFMSFSSVTYDNAGYSKVISFSFTSGITFPNFTGKTNFEALFLSNVDFAYTYLPRFFRSLLFYVPIVVFISFVLAMLLNSKIRGRTFFRIIYFLPVVIVSGPVLTMLNGANTSGSSSIRLTLDGSSVAQILSSLSPKALQYANEVFQNFIIILWMTGVPIVLFISALQKINRQLYEAADIDGANGWQKLWTITFPLIKSVLLIVCMFTIMQVTTINVSFVNPINSWLENSMHSGRTNLGIVALGAWCQTLIVLLFVLISFLLFREKEFISKDKNYEEVEEIKRKRAQRKARVREILHISDIQAFFAKVFAPITNLKEARKAKKKEKEEMGG